MATSKQVVNNNFNELGDDISTNKMKHCETENDKNTLTLKEALVERNKDFGSFAVEYPLVENNDGLETIWPVSSENMEKGKELVVVLLGWGNALDKHVAKYSELYLSRGCIIVRYTAPGKVVMFNHDQLPRLTSKLIQKLKDLELDTHPMFFHIFSNGGGFTYSYLLAELTISHEHLDIRGTIFDSSPSPRELGAYFRALVNIFEPYNGFRYVMAGVTVILLVVAIFWLHLKSAFRFCINGDTVGFEKGRPTFNWLSRISQYRNHNFLFIYSDADKIIRSHQIERFATFMAEQENRVQYLHFKDSPHVQHYRMYPKEYLGSITKFIREVMMDGKNRTHYPTQY